MKIIILLSMSPRLLRTRFRKYLNALSVFLSGLQILYLLKSLLNKYVTNPEPLMAHQSIRKDPYCV
jgi:hypothetical protein